MENPNIKYNKVWRRKQMQEDKENEKLSTVMLSSFAKEKGHDESIGTLDEENI